MVPLATKILRSALHPYPAQLVLVSKVGAARDDNGGWLPAQRPEQLRQGVLDNLTALAIERLDVVNLRLTQQTADGAFDEQVDAMIEMRDEGLIGGSG